MGDQPLLATGGCVVVTVRQSFFFFFKPIERSKLRLLSVIDKKKVNMDDFLSRWKTLNFPKEEIMNSI